MFYEQNTCISEIPAERVAPDRQRTYRQLAIAMETLDNQLQAAALLRYEYGYSYRQLGIALGVSPMTALRRVRRAEHDIGGRMTELKTLSHSSMLCARTCQRQYWYRYQCKLRRVEEAQALRFGTAWHRIMQAWRDTDPWDRDADKLLDVADELDLDPMERAALNCLAIGYAAQYPDDPAYTHVEQGFSMPLRNPDTGGVSRTWQIVGAIDAIDEHNRVWEVKTAGNLTDEDMWLRLRADPQCSLYYLAAQSLNVPVSGIVYDVVRRPTLRPSLVPILDDDGLKIVMDTDTGQRAKNKNGTWRQTAGADNLELQRREETPEEFSRRLMADIRERPEAYFQRRMVTRLTDDLLDYQREVWQQGTQLQDAIRLGRWHRHVSRYTCKYCEYAPLCLHGVTYDPEQDAPPDGYYTPDTHTDEEEIG